MGTDNIQLVTISRPSAYGEYELYHFCDTEDEFKQAVTSMAEGNVTEESREGE